MVNTLLIVSAVAAEAIGTFTGFGAVTILLPIATFFMPIKEAVVFVSIFHLFGTTFRTMFFARKINVKIALLFGIPSLLASIVGASLLSYISADLLTKIVGALIVVYASYSLLKEKIVLPKNNFVLVIGGGIVGFAAGLVGTAGAMRGAILTAWSLAPEVYLGTGAIVGLGADAARVVVYFKDGLIRYDATTILTLLIVALAGTIVGKFLVTKTKEKSFAKIVFIALILAGVRLFFMNG